jgi:hypothetical protein
MLVEDLELPTYVQSVLARAGIERVSDLLAKTPKELMGIPGLGQKSLEEIRQRLGEHGWKLPGDEGQVETRLPQEQGEGEVLLGAGYGDDDEPEEALLGGDSGGEDAPVEA